MYKPERVNANADVLSRNPLFDSDLVKRGKSDGLSVASCKSRRFADVPSVHRSDADAVTTTEAPLILILYAKN